MLRCTYSWATGLGDATNGSRERYPYVAIRFVDLRLRAVLGSETRA